MPTGYSTSLPRRTDRTGRKVFMNDYRMEEHKKLITLRDELNAANPSYRWAIDGDEEHEQVKMTDGAPIYCRKDWGGKGYSFMLWHKLPYVDYYAENLYKEGNKYNADQYPEHPEPRNVGVLNAKKVSEWINCLTDKFIYLQALSAERSKNITDFLAKAATVPNMIIKQRENNPPHGRAIKNGIEYSFEIDDRSGYISQKIELHYSIKANIETFAALSENAYKQI